MPKRNPTKQDKSRWNLWARYKLRPAEIEKMLREQDGKCAICGEVLGEKNTRIDHCHQSGKVRGLLCHQCNIKLPVVEECGWLMLAWAYLDEHG